jgi:uncharacterized membrane protein
MRRWFAPVVIALSVIGSLLVYQQLPERMPVHWDLHGTVDRYGSRIAGAFFLPGMMLGLWILMRLVPRIDPRRASYEKFADTYDLLVNSLIALFAVMHVALIATALGWPVSMGRLVPALVGLEFLILGNALPRARPNWWFGIRTPWTLSNDRVWTRTHRVGGYLLAGAGLVLLVAAAVPSRWTAALGGAAVFVAGAGSLVYSFLAWKQETSK